MVARRPTAVHPKVAKGPEAGAAVGAAVAEVGWGAIGVDVIRAVVGDATLHYFGASYGHIRVQYWQPKH